MKADDNDQRALARIARHRDTVLVGDERKSGNGVFIFLRPEFRCAANDTRLIHEDTVAEAIDAFRARRRATAHDD